MLRLWPTKIHADEHDDYSAHAELPDGLAEAVCLARQAVHLEPQPGGWKIIIDSAVETGRVELFIPADRTEPARIVTDTRAESISMPFESLYAGGYYAEAAVVAERELQAARQSTTGTAVVADASATESDISSNQFVLVTKLKQVALASLRKGNYEQTESALDEAIAICEAKPASFAETLVRLLHLRATTRYLYRCTDEESTLEVRRELAHVWQRAEDLVGREHPATALILTSQARSLISEFSYPEAEELLTEALSIQQQAFGEKHPDVAESMLELARLNAYREDHEAADEGFQRAIAIRESCCGPSHPDVADALFHYTDFLMYNLRDAAKAGALLRRALAIWEETIGLDHSLLVRETAFIRKVLSSDTEPAESL